MVGDAPKEFTSITPKEIGYIVYQYVTRKMFEPNQEKINETLNNSTEQIKDKQQRVAVHKLKDKMELLELERATVHKTPFMNTWFINRVRKIIRGKQGSIPTSPNIYIYF